MEYVDLNNLGDYASIAELWMAHPEGGREGDYATVGGVKYRWNKYEQMWVNGSTHTSTTARKLDTHNGDVLVGNDLTVLGTLHARQMEQPEKGLFASSEALVAAYPSPQVGDWAVVGDTLPGAVWRCTEAGVWAATGETGGLSPVDLTLYVQKSSQEAVDMRQDAQLAMLEEGLYAVGEEAAYIERAPDLTRPGYGIRASTSEALQQSELFSLYGYLCGEGERWRLSMASNGATSTWARVYAFYSCSTLEAVSSSNNVPYTGETVRRWNGESFADEVAVPYGARLLVVTVVNSLLDKLTVSRATALAANTLFPRVSALESAASGLESRIEEVEAASHAYEYETGVQADTGIDYTVREGGTGYGLNSRGVISQSEWAPAGATEYVYQLMVYSVTAGESWRIVRGGSTGTVYKAWSFMSANGPTEVLEGTLIATSEQTLSSKGTFDVTVPEGANLLVVVLVTSIAAPEVYKRTAVTVSAALDDVGERIDRLASSIGGGSMAVSRPTLGNVFVTYNRGDGLEMIYHFGDAFLSPQTRMNLRGVYTHKAGGSSASMLTMLPGDAVTLDSQTGSDMIGPIEIAVSADGRGVFVGGNHAVSGVRTATLERVDVSADGCGVLIGDRMECRSVKVRFVNTISHPDWGNICEETIDFEVLGDHMAVSVRHEYKYDGAVDKYITKYYGMQSNAFGARETNKLRTIGGAYDDGWVQIDGSNMGFYKSAYPLFTEFLLKRADGWCQRMRMDPDFGIGGHTLLAANSRIFVDGNYNKFYHQLINGTLITSGMVYEWRGVYRWTKSDNN